MLQRRDEALARIADWFFRHREAMAVYAASLLLHVLMLLVLAAIVLPGGNVSDMVSTLFVHQVDNPQVPLEPVEVVPEVLNPGDVDSMPEPLHSDAVSEITSPVEMEFDDLERSLVVPPSDWARVNIPLDRHLAGRSKQARSALLARFGGNAASEAAVAAGLEWLAAHQNSDGSWSFDHRREACGEDCTQPGYMNRATTAATGMALMAFLGAGHTHLEGDYRSQVQKGIAYLLKEGKEGPDGLDLTGSGQGNSDMYAHGLATIALCEAYAMTSDPKLRRPAQLAVNFIVRAQDKEGGGWRYHPGEAGDTSVVGWQVMALASARMGRLSVPERTRLLARKFLTSVQSDGGARYGYRDPGGKPSTTAIGLLCRMYLGWRKSQEPLKRGVAFLSERGPDRNNMYYNYYATQVLHHWGDRLWRDWNTRMRDWLVETQRKDGHARGSWDPRDPHAGAGGRLYMTCLCIMTLEVYYRHLPLYQSRSLSGR